MTKKQTTTRRSRKLTNDILEDHGDWLLVDISTSKFPDAAMAVDTDVWEAHEGGRVYASNNQVENYIYAMYRLGKKLCRFHRDVIDCDVIDCDVVDHIKHGTMRFIDNRRSNLRSATYSQNGMNRKYQVNNTSGIPGVSWHKRIGKWSSSIKVNNKRKHLGIFDNIEFAIGARQQAERELFGEFAHGGASND